jgi:hypothetical protein
VSEILDTNYFESFKRNQPRIKKTFAGYEKVEDLR